MSKMTKHFSWKCHQLRLLTCLFGLVFSSSIHGREQNQANVGPIEVSRLDWLAQKNWQSVQVSVSGFVLGISRQEATRVAARAHKKLVGLRGGRDEYPCSSERCLVETHANRYTGVELEFNSSDNIIGISIDTIPLDANPEVQEAGVTRSFVGETKAFFDKYSDTNRRRVLGEAESIRSDRNPPDSHIQRMEFSYPHLGLAVSVSVDDRRPDSPFDLSVKLVAPK
jgi:hypothetical protein